MREIPASEAMTRLPRLPGDVERGETIVITRHGRPIARLMPGDARRQEKIEKVLADLDDLRKTMPPLTLDEILSARHEGHNY
ncbi:MAG: type II toxin-antitoxin system Phd/YefM family antitoxin [Beijerinckiaceae bacterium]